MGAILFATFLCAFFPLQCALSLYVKCFNVVIEKFHTYTYIPANIGELIKDFSMIITICTYTKRNSMTSCYLMDRAFLK